MTARRRIAPTLVGIGLSAFVLSGAYAGGSIDLQYTTAVEWGVDSAGESYTESAPTDFDPLYFNRQHEFYIPGGGGDLDFTMRGRRVGSVDSYEMSTSTDFGWQSDSFEGGFGFTINDRIDLVKIEYGGYEYIGEDYDSPYMEVYNDGTLTNTLYGAADYATASGGDAIVVKIIWNYAPQNDGTETGAWVNVFPTAVPGSGALALLGLGGMVRRRRRLH